MIWFWDRLCIAHLDISASLNVASVPACEADEATCAATNHGGDSHNLTSLTNPTSFLDKCPRKPSASWATLMPQMYPNQHLPVGCLISHGSFAVASSSTSCGESLPTCAAAAQIHPLSTASSSRVACAYATASTTSFPSLPISISRGSRTARCVVLVLACEPPTTSFAARRTK